MTAEHLIGWLVENDSVEAGEVQADTLLFSTSLVDSFDMVDLVAFIEKESGVAFGPLDLNLDNLDSVNRIIAFLAKNTG